MPTLEVTDLSKRYENFTLGPLSFALEPGMVHGLIGANGAGKSTLFRCLTGMVRPDGGLVRFNGQATSPEASHWKQAIGYVADYTPLFENWSGARNLKTFARFYANFDEKLVRTLATRFGLNLEQLAGNYSSGQRNTLAIVHALAHGARFLLLDEPTSGLDPLARDTFMEVLFEQLDDELTILYATHYVTEIEPIADQLLFINDGKLLGCEMKEDLAQRWRRLSFRSEHALEAVPGQVTLQTVTRGDAAMEYEVISSNEASTRNFLEHAGVQGIQSSRLTLEQVCVKILKNAPGRQP